MGSRRVIIYLPDETADALAEATEVARQHITATGNPSVVYRPIGHGGRWWWAYRHHTGSVTVRPTNGPGSAEESRAG